MPETLRERFPLQRRKVLKKSLGSLLKILPIALIIAVICLWALFGEALLEPTAEWRNEQVEIVFGVIFLVVIVSFSKMIYEALYFVRYHYDFDEKNIIIRKGVVTTREITLPFSKITDVYVDQDILDVVLGLYDLHISTPTVESGRFAHIDGLNKRSAAMLRKLVLDKING